MPMDANEIGAADQGSHPGCGGDHSRFSPAMATTMPRPLIAESFRGKSRVAQHQIVYEALKGEMGGKCTPSPCRLARRKGKFRQAAGTRTDRDLP